MAALTHLQVNLRIKGLRAYGARLFVARQLVRLAQFVLNGRRGLRIEVK
jgi:hypothetical protein